MTVARITDALSFLVMQKGTEDEKLLIRKIKGRSEEILRNNSALKMRLEELQSFEDQQKAAFKERITLKKLDVESIEKLLERVREESTCTLETANKKLDAAITGKEEGVESEKKACDKKLEEVEKELLIQLQAIKNLKQNKVEEAVKPLKDQLEKARLYELSLYSEMNERSMSYKLKWHELGKRAHEVNKTNYKRFLIMWYESWVYFDRSSACHNMGYIRW
jgi:hypothetical protein